MSKSMMMQDQASPGEVEDVLVQLRKLESFKKAYEDAGEEADNRRDIARRALTLWRAMSASVIGWAAEAIWNECGELPDPRFLLRDMVLETMRSHWIENAPSELIPDNWVATMFPRDVHVLIERGLEALNFGEAQPLFLPAQTRKRGRYPFTEETLEFQAIQKVHFDYRSGAKKQDALEDVAKKFGISRAALEKMEARLRRAFPRKYKRKICLAVRAAKGDLEGADGLEVSRLREALSGNAIEDWGRNYKLRPPKARIRRK